MTTDDRDLTVADDAGWRQALEQPASQLPATSGQDYGEDFGRPGEQPHGSVPGIPVSADDYHLPIVPGFEWSASDRPNLESFLEVAHQSGMTQRQVQNLLRWYGSGIAADGTDGDYDVGDAPESPDGYRLIEGRWTQADAPLLEIYAQHMHHARAPRRYFNAGLLAYQDVVAALRAAESAGDDSSKAATHAELASRMGPEQKRVSVSLLKGYLAEVGALDKLTAARTPDGNLLLNDPDIASWLIGVARKQFAGGYSDRKGQIEHTMKHDYDRYLREGMDVEYQKILGSHRPSGAPRDDDADVDKSYREREIEKMISTDPSRYFGSEALQREYQELIARRQGGR